MKRIPVISQTERFFCFRGVICIAFMVLIVSIVSAQSEQEKNRIATNEAIEKRAREIEKTLTPHPQLVGRPISDRDAWNALAQKPGFKNAVADAERLAKTPIPELPESLYKEFFQNGNRTRYQNARTRKFQRLSVFTLAECLENQGRFIAPLEETIRSICDEPSWILPASDPNAQVYDQKLIIIDLFSAAMSVDLGIAVYWLGDKLSPEVRQLVLENVERRTFQPYEQSVKTGHPAHVWIRSSHNWNSVCHAGTVGAALSLIESPQRRAWFIAAAERFIDDFLKGFTPDGYCSEGMGYWNYGFGNFVDLAEFILQATDKKIDFFTKPGVREPALFAPLMEIDQGIFAAFADCPVTAKPTPELVGYLSKRFQFGLKDYEKYDFSSKGSRSLPAVGIYAFPNSLSGSEWERLAQKTAAFDVLSELRTEFPDAGVLICRPAQTQKASDSKFAFACKAGHNAEHHNHNDVGSFTLVYAGTLPILDPGGEIYTQRTFSGQRYVSGLLNSYGHPVPRINGQLQKAGRNAQGTILSKSFSEKQDVCVMNIADAYRLPELKKLQRTFEYKRSPDSPSLTVIDEFALEPSGTFESALETYEPWEKLNSDNSSTVLIVGEKGKQVHVEVRAESLKNDATEPLPLKFDTSIIEEDSMFRKKPTRFSFQIVPSVDAGRVVIRITPIL